MSQANRVGKQNARERVAEEKLKARKAARRRRQWTVGGTVVAVIAVSAGVAVAVNAAHHNNSPYVAPVSAVVDPITKSSKDLGILVGSSNAPVKMTVFEDFRCPACQAVEGLLESTYKQYISDGKLQVTYHPVRLIDGKNGGTGSLLAGNLAACAQDAGQFMAMHDVLYANQPNETTDGYGNNVKLLALASEIPALKSDAAFVSCVNSGTHKSWVQDNADVFNTIGLDSTPTIFLDGTKYAFQQNVTNQQALDKFKADLDAAFTKDGGKAGTPVTLPTAPPSALTPSGAASSSAGAAASSSASASSPAAPSSAESSTQPSASGTPSASKS